jgi:hypothetical protein
LGRVGGVTAPQALNVDSKRNDVSFTLWPLYASGKMSSYPKERYTLEVAKRKYPGLRM